MDELKDKYLAEIKTKYKSLDQKMRFVKIVAQKTGLDVFTVKNHHFGIFKIPMKYRRPYIKLLDAVLEEQKMGQRA